MPDRRLTWNLIGTALGLGLRKRCPHCGQGRLLSGWSLLERCTVCGLVFSREPGDTWAFTIFFNRLPVGVMIVLIYFGVARSYPVVGVTLLAATGVLAIATTHNRTGAGIALNYLLRIYWHDPADPMPPSPGARTPR